MTSGGGEALWWGEGRVTATASRPAPRPFPARAAPQHRPRAAATSRSGRHGARAPPPPSPPARLAAVAAAGAAAAGAARSHGREPRLGEPPHQELQEQGPRCGGECAPRLAGPGGREGRGRGPWPLALAGWRSVGVGRRLGAPRPGLQPPSERPARTPGTAGRSAPPRGRGLLSEGKGCGAEAGSAGRAGGRTGMLPPRVPTAPPGPGRRSRPQPVQPPALPHMEPPSQRLPCASRAQAGGGSPQRGVGTSRVTDLFEGGGWGRVGCAKTIFLYSSAVLWISLPELLQLILL